MRKLGVPCEQYYFNLLYIYTVQTGSMYWETCFLIFFAWYVILPPFRHCHGVVADLDHCSNARLSDRPFWRCQVQGCVQIHRGPWDHDVQQHSKQIPLLCWALQIELFKDFLLPTSQLRNLMWRAAVTFWISLAHKPNRLFHRGFDSHIWVWHLHLHQLGWTTRL